MHDANNPTPDSPSDAAGAPRGAPLAPWADTTGNEWTLELSDERIALRSGQDVVEVPRERWPIDVYAAPHGDEVIVRIEGDGNFIGFIVPPETARPLLAHVDQLAAIAPPPAEPEAPDPPRRKPSRTEKPASDRHKDRLDLLWPKVSPLAVWALFLSSVVFIPVVGIVSAAATATLLWLHGKRVRKTAAWSHSFALCRAALVLLAIGSVVNVVASRQMQKNISRSVAELPAPALRSPSSPFAAPNDDRLRASPRPTNAPQSAGISNDSAILADSFFDRDINWALVVAALFAVLLSLTVHEAAHAISAWWLGDDFARRLGRVTLNPAMHVDPFGTIILPVILFITGLGVFGWAKPVPVRTENTANPRAAHIWISLAGPGSNLILAAISLMLMIGIASIISAAAPQAMLGNFSSSNFLASVSAEGFAGAGAVAPLLTILKLSFVVNIFLAFFNLIPIPPLDGSWVVENLFPNSLGPLYAKIRPYSIILFLMLIYSKALIYLLLPAIWVLWAGLDLLALCTPF